MRKMAGNKLVIGLAAGALIGAVAGLLIAPKAVGKSRRMIGPRVVSEEETGSPVNGVVS